MTSVFTSQPAKALMVFPWRLLTICTLITLITCSCTPQEDIVPPQAPETTHIQIDGFTVPQLPSAAEQLFFARTSDALLPQRIALFKAVAILFTDKRTQIGLAELEIAYLSLGTDYRLSPPSQQQSTAEKYLIIATNYQDIPEVAAKALWYHGWITADLLGQKIKAMDSFLKTIKSYPDQPISRSPVVPWTSINIEQSSTSPPSNSTQAPLTWAGLAYLELVRHGQNAEECLNYYRSLIKYSSEKTLVFAALKLLATRSDLDSRLLSVIKTEIIRAGFEQKEAQTLTALLKKEAEG